jgi:Ni/Fe-hydrogenase 1 B-type cytochrome subunit
MQNENIKYVLIWSGWLRLSHWIIAFGVLFEIISAWAIGNDYVYYEFWRDWHIIVGQLILVALILRIVLFFTAGTSNWRTFFEYKSQFNAIVQTIKFYLSFTRLKLPNWYAHNPLWKPIYLFMIVVLSGCVITGLIYNSNLMLLGYTPIKMHSILATIIIALSAAHIFTAFLHDWKAKGAFISAIINGHRYFHYSNKEIADDKESGETPVVHISVDSVKNRSKIDQ